MNMHTFIIRKLKKKQVVAFLDEDSISQNGIYADENIAYIAKYCLIFRDENSMSAEILYSYKKPINLFKFVAVGEIKWMN